MKKLLIILIVAALLIGPAVYAAGCTSQTNAGTSTPSVNCTLNDTIQKIIDSYKNCSTAKNNSSPKPCATTPSCPSNGKVVVITQCPSKGAVATPKPSKSPVTATPQPAKNTATTAPKPSPSATNSSGKADNLSYEKQVAALVNKERAKYGLAPLTLNTKLSNVARVKSQDMHDKHYFSHTSPTYGSPFDMMRSFGISYRAAGENIAMGYGTPEAVMNAWMNSSGHRANILNANYTQIGVGYVADGHYWTQEFIG